MYDALETFLTPVDDFAAGIPMTPAERKRTERANRRAAVLPDPRVVDAAVATAMAEALQAGDFVGHCQRRGTVAGMTVDVEDVMRRAIACVSACNFDPVMRGIGVGPWGWTVRAGLIDRVAGSSEDEDHGPTPFPQHHVQASGRTGVPVGRDAARLGQAP